LRIQVWVFRVPHPVPGDLGEQHDIGPRLGPGTPDTVGGLRSLVHGSIGFAANAFQRLLRRLALLMLLRMPSE
jgi:hypothetical protein